jgi:hypothetical protein
MADLKDAETDNFDGGGGGGGIIIYYQIQYQVNLLEIFNTKGNILLFF